MPRYCPGASLALTWFSVTAQALAAVSIARMLQVGLNSMGHCDMRGQPEDP